MSRIPYDPNDKSLIGPALEVLRFPGVSLVYSTDIPYDISRPQQNWQGTGDIDAFQLLSDEESAHLIPYWVPAAWVEKPNLQPINTSWVKAYSPIPLRALADDESREWVRS